MNAKINLQAEEPPKTMSPPWRRHRLLCWLFPNNLKTDTVTVRSWMTMAFESTLFCLIALILSGWLLPNNPFGVSAQFPWLWLVPAVLAMRYGTSIGIWAVAVFFGSWFFLHEYSDLIPGIAMQENTPLPQSYFVGGLVLVMLCGQFYDTWHERYRKVMAANSYFSERLQAVTRNHFLLRLSHERLEQDILAKPMTLRETLVRLRDLIRLGAEVGQAMPGAEDFLQILGQSCQLQVAEVYSCNQAGIFCTNSIASLGGASEVSLMDPLVIYCLERRSVTNVRNTAELQDRQSVSRYLICAPIIASSGRILGLVTVEKLPFFALNNDVLQLMSVLTGYYADGLDHDTSLAAIQKHIPACPNDFALDMIRLDRIRVSAGIESSLVALVFENDPDGIDLFKTVARMHRGIDLYWQCSAPQKHVLITLLPLSGTAAVEGYLHRIEQSLRSLFSRDFSSARITAHVGSLREPSPDITLKNLLERCGV